jgi:hypothetical protein
MRANLASPFNSRRTERRYLIAGYGLVVFLALRFTSAALWPNDRFALSFSGSVIAIVVPRHTGSAGIRSQRARLIASAAQVGWRDARSRRLPRRAARAMGSRTMRTG